MYFRSHQIFADYIDLPLTKHRRVGNRVLLVKFREHLWPEFEVDILEIPHRPNSPTFESGMQNINGSCSSLGGIGGRREPESAQPLVEQKIVPCVEAAFLLWWCSFRNRVSRGLMVIRSACQRFKPSETLFALPSF
ncbi:hypothetical protein TWF102_006353 [Orbilia oligospora]|uniref:Uncharacterized protein n=1 Tax=Orbilia oligospora TaxID=2813651 RepID=A0A7C8N7J6_ORBOL|nr:hypothetical protein TWF102_006353 [Orbilia oligospora]